MQSFVKQHVVDYEYDKALCCGIDAALENYSMDDSEDLVEFLSEHECTIRKIMGWEQITF